MGHSELSKALEHLAAKIYLAHKGQKLPTKSHVRDCVRKLERSERGFPIPDATELVLGRISKFRHVNNQRRESAPATQVKLKERLAALKRRRIARAFFNQYRSDSGGHTKLRIRLSDKPSEIGVLQNTVTDWDVYRGDFKGWAYHTVVTTLTVPHSWYSRVHQRGLHDLDGMMCLDATSLDGAPAGVELFAAKWLVQSRGYNVRLESGVIARRNDISFHGRDSTAALKGLRKKVAVSERWSAISGLPLESLVQTLGSIVENWTVSIDDARRIGACEYGIRHWCETVGLDYDGGRASFSEVYEAYQRHPATEARAVLLRVIRRNRVRAATRLAHDAKVGKNPYEQAETMPIKTTQI